MALVSHILSDCPKCGRKDGFGNVSVSNNFLNRGCLSCKYWVEIPLPDLDKKIIYLDQYFFSHAFRGNEQIFIEAKDKIQNLALEQLIVAPYSNFHEDESSLFNSDNRENLIAFIKQTSGGHQFLSENKVRVNQICRAFTSFLAKSTLQPPIQLRDAVPQNFNDWDNYLWIDVNSLKIDPEALREGKGETLNSLLDAFDEWSNPSYTFEQDVNFELRSIGNVYIQSYFDFVKEIFEGNFQSAWLNSSSNSEVVQILLSYGSEQFPPDERLKRILEFFKSKYFSNVPIERISSEFFALLRHKLRQGFYKNKIKSRKVFKGFLYDVRIISTYAPYCDVMVVDKMMHDWAIDPLIDLPGKYGTRFFSRTNWPEFINYLDELDNSKSSELISVLRLVHPPEAKQADWSKILNTTAA